MKLKQKRLPLTLTTTNQIDEDEVYEWIISYGAERPEITLDKFILERLLCLPFIKKPLINRTELDSPFCGKSYVELFEDDTKIELFPRKTTHTYSEHLNQTGLFTISEHMASSKFVNSIIAGGIADYFLSSGSGLYMSFCAMVGSLSVYLNYGQTEKKIFEKIVADFETAENDPEKINVDYVLSEMNRLTNDPSNIKNALSSFMKEKTSFDYPICFLEPSIDMKSVSGEITDDGVSATMTAKTPFFMKIEQLPIYTDAISNINITGKTENVELTGFVESMSSQELYILVKNEDELSRLVDITDTLSTELPDEFALGTYGEIFDVYGYIIDGKFVNKLSEPFYQSHIQNSGLMLKAEINNDYRYITKIKKMVTRLKDIGLKVEPVYFDGKTMYDMVKK